MFNGPSPRPALTAELLPTHELLSAVVQMSESGLAVFDETLRLASWNDHFFMILGYPETLRAVGVDIDDFVRHDLAQPPDAAPGTDSNRGEMARLAALGQTREQTWRTADGQQIHCETLGLRSGGLIWRCQVAATQPDTTSRGPSSGAGADDAMSDVMEILEAVGDAFVCFDADDTLLHFNKKYLELYSCVGDMLKTGTSFEALLRAFAEKNTDALDGRSIDEYVAWRLEKRKTAPCHFEIALNEDRWLHVSERRTQNGGIFSVHTDITEIKQREKALRSLSEQIGSQNILFDAALNNMVQGLCMFDKNQRLIVVNKRYIDMYNFSPAVVKPGITLREIMEYSVALGNYSREDGERALSERPSQAEQRQETTSLQYLEDGRIIAVMHSPLPSGGSVATYEDVTERESTEATLREYASRLEKSNRELQDFAFVASHDLQEPLRKIESFGERLSTKFGPALGEDGRMYVSRMQNAADRMRRLITDLLSYSRITTQAQPFQPVDLHEIVKDMMSDLQITLEETKATIQVDFLPIVSADPTQMRQLFQNLVSNSLKFRKSDILPQVRISGKLIEVPKGVNRVIEFAEIILADNGIGFEDKYAERIFAIFQRLHGRSEYDGTGIGLATCRKIVDRHNGSIKAEGRLGEGATFTIRLPVKQQESESNE